MKRIFIAINLPEAVKNELSDLEKEIAGLFPEESKGIFRWVKKDNLHITLLFIGAVKEEAIFQIKKTIKEVIDGQETFFIKLRKVCYGPTKEFPPRLVWVELEKKAELLELAEKLKREVTQAGILRKFEQRGFSPHITLGRIRAWRWRRIEPEERPTIEREIDLNFEVKSIEVMESVLKRTEADYSVLASIQLLGL